MVPLYLFHKVLFTISMFFPSALVHRRRRSEEYPFQVSHKQKWGHGFIFLPSHLLYCPDQMLAVIVFTSGFVIQNCQTSCSMWCSMYGVPYSQFGEEARSYLCMDEWNCPTPVRRQLDLTQAIRSKLNLTGLALVIGMKARSLDVLSQYSVFGL